ncbi:hypothetical protein BTA35_0202790 [Oceanospirillum linum]|uniref:DUF5666 domain-containing protein n=1 Tax=Oceanospirillum linum TaxID=966 RepID=A0A1T1HF46_OCELI|nr:hypothetical protein [Oceanospirillum linum]OOV88453.1 hypothetical protein BTA35_0202790 [Oceanospirillum linum]
MKRLLTSVALLGACLPTFADTSPAEGYQLPTDTVLKVQVLMDKNISQGETVSHLLLKSTGSETGATLPERCLLSADAAIDQGKLSLHVNRALCVEPNGHIFDGVMDAVIISDSGNQGVTTPCVGSSCNQAVLQAGVDYRLKLNKSADIALGVNQTEQINIQRRNHTPDAAAAQ